MELSRWVKFVFLFVFEFDVSQRNTFKWTNFFVPNELNGAVEQGYVEFVRARARVCVCV